MKTIVCPYCGRKFTINEDRKVIPHKCIGGFRKNFHNRPWKEIELEKKDE